MLGSSRTYNTPVKREPICVAKRIRCASPPLSVPALRFSVKYSKPTFIKNDKRELISLIIKLEISFCSLLNFNVTKNSYKSRILSLVIS